MNPKQFLKSVGLILVVLALLGLFNILGPTADQSVFGTAWWFDSTENLIYIILGTLFLLFALMLPITLNKYIVIAIGITTVLLGLYSIFNTTIFSIHFETPADSALLLIMGVWALWAAPRKILPKSV